MSKVDINAIIDSMTLDEMLGQMMCFNVDNDDNELREICKETHCGCFFVGNNSPERIKELTAILNENAKVPAIIAADIECGPGHILAGETKVTNPMSWGACNDEELIRKAHIAVAERCREMGVHWSFAPISDINYNPDNPVTNVRAVSDIPERVARICGAVIDGMQENGMIMAGCKHFPGDGVDDRNQHLCTTVNSLSREEWMNTFGYVYKELFKHGAASVMVGHIALPAYDEKENDWAGYRPGTLSYNLITKLLKGELGFEGCVVSDALCMVGACSIVSQERLPVEFVKAGGDVLLFPTVEYFRSVKEAVLSGEIPMERIRDAATRVLKMKERARLFEDQEEVIKSMPRKYNLEELTQEIADKSLSLIRNYGDSIPLKAKKGDKLLLLNLKRDSGPENIFYSTDLDILENELRERGFELEVYNNGNRADFSDHINDFAAVLINCKLSSQDYPGGTLRIGFQHISPFWRGAVLQHPHVIFTSFGDPYKIHDFPYLKTYINAYSCSAATQKAFVKALFGEIPFAGKSPVSFPPYFEAEY